MTSSALRRRFGLEGNRRPFDAETARGVRRATIVVAHMDDEINQVGLLSRLRALGVQLDIVVLTDGAANPWTDERVVAGRSHFECRRDELNESMRLLGLERSVLPQFPDSALMQHLPRATDSLVDFLRASKPDLVITFEPRGINRHPDHMAAHLASRRALAKLEHPCGLALMTPPPPFCWALGADFAWDRDVHLATLELSAPERVLKSRVYGVYASQWKTLRLLTGGLPPHIFFSIFPTEWYLWLSPDEAAAWVRWVDSP